MYGLVGGMAVKETHELGVFEKGGGGQEKDRTVSLRWQRGPGLLLIDRIYLSLCLFTINIFKIKLFILI